MSYVSLQPLKFVKRQVDNSKLMSKDQSEVDSKDSPNYKQINSTSTEATLLTESGNLQFYTKLQIFNYIVLPSVKTVQCFCLL